MTQIPKIKRNKIHQLKRSERRFFAKGEGEGEQLGSLWLHRKRYQKEIEKVYLGQNYKKRKKELHHVRPLHGIRRLNVTRERDTRNHLFFFSPTVMMRKKRSSK